MSVNQQIFPVRRHYNQWVVNETLEDYALRFTAKKARRWSIERVAMTALGTTAFLALEALGPVSGEAVGVITATVLLSVLAHGISAAPLATRYGRAAAGPEPGGPVPVAPAPARGLSRKHTVVPRLWPKWRSR